MQFCWKTFHRTLFQIATCCLLLSSAIVRAETIGLSLPLGGPSAPLAKQFLQGAELAIETLGGDHELFVVDDGCVVDIGQLAAEDLAAKGIAIATGYLCNETATIAANRFRNTGVPVLVAGARSIRLIKDRDREDWNLWRFSPGDDFPATAAANALSDRWKDVPYAIVDDGTIYGRTFSDNFRARMEQAGTPPQFFDNFRSAQSTQAGLIRRLQRSGVRAVFVAAATAEDVLIIANNAATMEVPLEIASSEPLGVLPYLEGAAEVPPGLLVMMQPSGQSIESAASLLNLLDARNITPEPGVFTGYATLEIVIAAVADNPDRTTENLAKLQFETVLGPVKFDETGKNTVNRFVLHRWNGSEVIPLTGQQPIEPDTQ